MKSGNVILKFKEREYRFHDWMTYIVPSDTGFSLAPVTEYHYLTIWFRSHLKDKLNQYISTEIILPGLGEELSRLSESYRSKQYIFQGKMRLVRQEIMAEKSTAQIAADLNFSAQSHLCCVFKKYMGISVEDYKKSITKGEIEQ